MGTTVTVTVTVTGSAVSGEGWLPCKLHCAVSCTSGSPSPHIYAEFDYSSALEKTSLDCWLRTSVWFIYQVPFCNDYSGLCAR